MVRRKQNSKYVPDELFCTSKISATSHNDCSLVPTSTLLQLEQLTAKFSTLLITNFTCNYFHKIALTVF